MSDSVLYLRHLPILVYAAVFRNSLTCKDL